ncbi:MAG: TlpA family protein disulfide reductase [bacterium]|nr:TlpA family protein disulfide reductase [bacterium]
MTERTAIIGTVIGTALALSNLGAASVGAQAPTSPTSVRDLLKGHGIRPIQPPTPATDFELQDLAGGRGSLSDHYGNWVVLTFFATWCGPCRTELPTLERLHQQRGGSGVVVLGVSIDDPDAPVESFVRQLGLTFPILWDPTKQVGATYRASSIPVSYLVDPLGRLVGVSRGSRDWASLTPMLDAALAAVPATSGAPPPDVYADAGEAVATPTVSDPPTAEVRIDTETPEAGQPFHLDIELHWAGNFEEYLPHPPEILLPEGVVQESVTAESSSADGRNQLTYRATLRADEPGRYALDPVEVRYTPRFESEPVAGRVAGPTVTVVAPTIFGMAPVTVAAGAGGLVILGLAGLLLGRKLRASGKRTESPALGLYEDLHARFEESRKLRLAGDGAGTLLALADLDRSLRGDEEPDEAARKSLQEAVERARYGGEVPPAEELDKLQRDVARRLDELRPDTESQDRASIKLKDQ